MFACWRIIQSSGFLELLYMLFPYLSAPPNTNFCWGIKLLLAPFGYSCVPLIIVEVQVWTKAIVFQLCCPTHSFLSSILPRVCVHVCISFILFVTVCMLHFAFWYLFVAFTIFNYAAGDILSLFAGIDYSSSSALVDYRMKQLAYACIWAVHHNRLFVLHIFTLILSCLEFGVICSFVNKCAHDLWEGFWLCEALHHVYWMIRLHWDMMWIQFFSSSFCWTVMELIVMELIGL